MIDEFGKWSDNHNNALLDPGTISSGAECDRAQMNSLTRSKKRKPGKSREQVTSKFTKANSGCTHKHRYYNRPTVN